ncbi:MAG: BLUF domain-containing protein [Bacteroidales bacterium]
MRCVVYISHETRPLKKADILDILRVSRVKNTVRRLTGVLLYYDGIFLQVLEGEGPVIEEMLALLRRDRRHTEIRILLDEPVAERYFPDWSMAFADLADLPPDDRWLCRHLDRPLAELHSGELADRIRRLVGSFQVMVRQTHAAAAP